MIIIILADLDKLPLHLLMRIPHYDWAAHAVLYGLFYGLLDSFLNLIPTGTFRFKSREISFALLITSSLIIAEEFSQIFFASRTFSIMDIFMGFLGIYLFKRIWGKRNKIPKYTPVD
jgi:glycopeptide antibiotics resistance protein